MVDKNAFLDTTMGMVNHTAILDPVRKSSGAVPSLDVCYARFCTMLRKVPAFPVTTLRPVNHLPTAPAAYGSPAAYAALQYLQPLRQTQPAYQAARDILGQKVYEGFRKTSQTVIIKALILCTFCTI